MTAFTIPAIRLAEAAGWVERLVPARPADPVLAGVVVDADEDGLTLSAYDYSTAGTVHVAAAAVSEPGRLLVSAKLLSAIARTAPKTSTLEVRVEGGQLWLSAGRSEWQVPLLPIDDYPRLPELGDPVGLFATDNLTAALARVLPAAGRDDTIPMLTGVRVESDGDQVTFTCTDRFRLATTDIPWSNHGDNTLDLLVPATLMAQAARAFGGGGDTVTVTASSAGFGLSTDTHQITGRLLDATFPRWRPLVGRDDEHYADVDVPGLRAALDQVAVYGDGTLRLDVTADMLVLSVAGDDKSARADAAVVELAGEPMSAGISPTYLRDALDSVGVDVARVFLGGPRKPLLFTPGGDHVRHLVMPIRLPDSVAS